MNRNRIILVASVLSITLVSVVLVLVLRPQPHYIEPYFRISDVAFLEDPSNYWQRSIVNITIVNDRPNCTSPNRYFVWSDITVSTPYTPIQEVGTRITVNLSLDKPTVMKLDVGWSTVSVSYYFTVRIMVVYNNGDSNAYYYQTLEVTARSPM